MSQFHVVARDSIQTLNLNLCWDVPGVAQPVVRGRGGGDGPGTTAVGVRVGAQTFARQRQFGRPDTQYETVAELVKRVAMLTGTAHRFELVYDLLD